jgi:hypothetical protein
MPKGAADRVRRVLLDVPEKEGKSMDDNKIKLGVLWKNVSRNGKKPYLSGRVQQDNIEAAVQLMRQGGRLLVLSNTKRPDKQDPDCVLLVVPEPDRRDDRGSGHSEAQSRVSPEAERSKARTGPDPRGPR